MATAADKPVFLFSVYDYYFNEQMIFFVPTVPSVILEYIDSVNELKEEKNK